MRNFMMLHIYYLLLLLMVGCSPQTSVLPPSVITTNPVIKEPTLKELNSQVLIGSHIDTAYDNAKYMDIIKTEFNSCQALWFGGSGWLGAGKYDFERINRNVNWMKQNGVSSHVHMLVGHDSYTPSWIRKGTWNGTELDSMMHDLIYSIMDTNDNKEKVDIWNVANELFNDDGTYRTKMVWNKIGWETDSSGMTGIDKINDEHPLFIRKAFTYCREKTNKKLELRDYNIETNELGHDGNDRRHKAFYQLLKHMLNTHIPIDAVGIQAHLSVGNINWILDNNGLKEAVKRFKSLGLEVYITELDARIEKRTWTEELSQKQRADYYNYIKQAIEGGATRINFWGIQDGLDKGWITTEHPLPWDENLNRKPAYFGVQQALKETNK